MSKTKYQVFEYTFLSGNSIDQIIDENIDKRFKVVEAIYIYSNPIYGSNQNFEFSQPLTIDGIHEIASRNMDSFLFYPAKQNEEFTHLREPVKLDNSKIEGRIRTGNPLSGDVTLKIVLKVTE